MLSSRKFDFFIINIASAHAYAHTVMMIKMKRRSSSRKRAIVKFACLSVFVFVCVGLNCWFGEGSLEQIERAAEFDDYKVFLNERAINIENERGQKYQQKRRRTLKDYAAIFFTQNLCFDILLQSGGPYFCLYPVICFGSDFYSCMNNAGVVQSAYGIDQEQSYGFGTNLLNSI